MDQTSHTWAYTQREDYKANHLYHWLTSALKTLPLGWHKIPSSTVCFFFSNFTCPNHLPHASCGVKINGMWLRAAFVFESWHKQIICRLCSSPNIFVSASHSSWVSRIPHWRPNRPYPWKAGVSLCHLCRAGKCSRVWGHSAKQTAFYKLLSRYWP